MLPRRGYEPVEDAEDYVHSETVTNNSNLTRSEYSPIPASVPDEETGGAPPDAIAAKASSEMTVRILDVQGQTYSFSVLPTTTVREIKDMLSETAGVEIALQRIIFGGKLLADSDTLASRSVFDGAAIHLFKKPKGHAYPVGLATAAAQQPGGLGDIPPLMLHIQEGGGRSQVGYLDTSLELEAPRRGIRFLASALLLVSIMEVSVLLESLASISAAMTTPEGHGDAFHPVLTSEYWMLVRARSLSSVLGVIVGVLGVRGSQSLDLRTIKLYCFGLVVCAIVAISIRIEVLYDVFSGKIPFGDYESDGLTSSSTDVYEDSPSGGSRGDRVGPERGDENEGGMAEPGDGEVPPEAHQNNLTYNTFIAFLAMVCSGGVWFLCIRRARRMRADIEVNLDRRHLLLLEEMRQQRERDAVAVPRLESGRGEEEASALRTANSSS